MVVARPQCELVVVCVLSSYAPLYLLQLLLEASGGIVEALEDTRYAGNAPVVGFHSLVVVLSRLTLFDLGIGGNKQLIGIGSYGYAVKFVDRYHQRGTDTQVGGDELAVVVATEVYL